MAEDSLHSPSAEPTPPNAPEPTLGALFAKLSEQSSNLVRNEVELVKAEAKQTLVRSGVSSGAFLVAGAPFWVYPMPFPLG